MFIEQNDLAVMAKFIIAFTIKAPVMRNSVRSYNGR